MYKLIIFDLDGTILDTSEGIVSSVRYMIHRMGYDMPEEDVIRSFVGPRIQDSLKRVFGMEGEPLKTAAELFRSHYKEYDVLKATPYAGVYKAMKVLYNKVGNLAVVTNKRQDFAESLMMKFELDQYIKQVIGTDFAGKLNKEDLMAECLERFGIQNKQEVVLIGDSAYDAEAAASVKIDFVGVTYGFEFKSKEDVDCYPNVGSIDSIIQLLDILS